MIEAAVGPWRGVVVFKVKGVLDGAGLGGGVLAGALFEEDVVGGVGVEGRVEVDEVEGLSGDVVSEDGQGVAEVELVGVGHWRGPSMLRVGAVGRQRCRSRFKW